MKWFLLAAEAPDSVPYAWVAVIVGALVSVVVLFWRLLDGRAAEAVKASDTRADKYEKQRDEAMEMNKAQGLLLQQIIERQKEDAQHCRDGLARVEALLRDTERTRGVSP